MRVSDHVEYLDITEDEAKRLIDELELVGVSHMGGDVYCYYQRSAVEAMKARKGTYGELTVFVANWPYVPPTWAKNVLAVK